MEKIERLIRDLYHLIDVINQNKEDINKHSINLDAAFKLIKDKFYENKL